MPQAGGTGACQGQRRERDWAAGDGRAAEAGWAGPGGAGAPKRARSVRMACTARGSCTAAMTRNRWVCRGVTALQNQCDCPIAEAARST